MADDQEKQNNPEPKFGEGESRAEVALRQIFDGLEALSDEGIYSHYPKGVQENIIAAVGHVRTRLFLMTGNIRQILGH